MAMQLQFSRHAYVESGVRDSSDMSPRWKVDPRHVAFTVHDAVPSPQLYQQQQQQQQRRPQSQLARSFSDEFESLGTSYRTEIRAGVNDMESMRRVERVQPSVAPIPSRAAPSSGKNKMTKKAAKPAATQKAPVIARPSRKPGWDTDVKASAPVFDASLKKSLLFQPRSGDRQREVQQEGQQLGRATAAAPLTKARVTATTTSAWNARITKSLPSRGQPRRKTKDFLKLNMERITGQRYEQLMQREARTSQAVGSSVRGRESVFDRLAAPVIHKSLLRFRSPSPTRVETTSHRAMQHEATAPPSPYGKLAIPSPVVAPASRYESDRVSPLAHRHPNRHPSPSSFSKRSSPNQERYSPGSSRAVSSPGFRSHSVMDHQPNQATRVFEVLDRQARGRIGVNQILDGLRLLGLPATHNQVADYVYLIHEGAMSSIDMEEWGILVGTLDAASQPVDSAQPPGSSVASRSSLSPSPCGYNRGSVGSSSRPSPNAPRPHPKNQSPPSPQLRPSTSKSVQYSPPPRSSSDHQYQQEQSNPVPNDPEDWYMHAIQRRVDEMYERAEQIVAQRSRQQSGNENSDQVLLERAASAVYQLKSSLFPLIEQAEATLHNIQSRKSSRLSVLLPPNELTKIADKSDDLANLLLDDLLLDTVEELNKDEQRKSQFALRLHHAETLDEILLKIETLEMAEQELVENQFARGYQHSFRSDLNTNKNCTWPPPPAMDKIQVSEHNAPAPSTTDQAERIQLPLSMVMALDYGSEECEEALPTSPQNDATAASGSPYVGSWTGHFSDNDSPPLPPPVAASMAAVSGQTYQKIEKNRSRFLKHRQLVESSLESTGMDQATVIEMLADLILDEIAEECAVELEGGVEQLTDTLAMSLL